MHVPLFYRVIVSTKCYLPLMLDINARLRFTGILLFVLIYNTNITEKSYKEFLLEDFIGVQ